MKREDLYRRLDELNRAPDRAAELEAALWQQVGAERAIFVSDMAGFTRLTRQRGILYFLGQFRKAACVAEELIARHGATFWKTAADNVIATFPGMESALATARDFAKLSFDEVRPCVGVGYGRVLELEDDVFGDEVNITYKLGEDLAEPGEVLLTSAAAKLAVGFPIEGPQRVEMGGVEVPYYRLR